MKDDVISRQQAIDALMERFKRVATNAIIAKDVIENLPSAQPEQKWIPCSERLPEKSGSYLVSGRWGSGKISVGDCEYSASDGYFRTAWNFDVHAWMPLPKAYQKEGTRHVL